jgi:hypothetical protein
MLNYFTKSINGKVFLYIEEACPLYHSRKGLCHSCDMFLGLSKTVRQMCNCNVQKYLMPIDHFRKTQFCPKKDGECVNCKEFLGFANDGFFCLKKGG